MAAKQSTGGKILDEFCVEDVLEMYEFLGETRVWIKDQDLRYRWANAMFLLNHSLPKLSQLVGRTDYELSPVYLVDLYQADDAKVLSGAAIIARVEPVGTYEALPSWNQTWKLPLRNRKGKIAGTLGLSRQLPATDAPDFPFPDLVPVLDHMRKYCAETISVVELAKLADLSVSALERKFKRHIQMTPIQFLSRLRIMRAAADLCNTFDPIHEITYRHGFSDQSHFTREFRKHFGKTPSTYRKSHQLKMN